MAERIGPAIPDRSFRSRPKVFGADRLDRNRVVTIQARSDNDDSPGNSSGRARRGAFDEHEEISCAQRSGQPMDLCEAAVARGRDGDATVVVTFSNGFARTLYFADGAFTAANPTMSGVGTDTDSSLVDGTHLIRVEGQRFELPDAFVFGK